MTLSHATVTLSFIPGSTRPCHGSSLAYAGLPHTDEHLCDHVVITITLTSTLLSPRPGWNRRWCYHRQVPITLCDNHSIISTSSHSAIWHKPTNYGRIHTSAFSGHKSLNSHSFCPLSRPCFRHFALLDAVFQPHVGKICLLSSLTLLKELHLYPIPLWNFFQFLATRNIQKCRYLVVFSTHSSGLTLGNPLGAFRHKQDFHCCKHDFQIFDNARMSYVH